LKKSAEIAACWRLGVKFASPQWEIGGGAGIDDPDDEDLGDASRLRKLGLLIGPLAISYFFELIRMYRVEYLEDEDLEVSAEQLAAVQRRLTPDGMPQR
jgi:hypothetical protein